MTILSFDFSSSADKVIASLVQHGSELGWTLLKALLVFIVGRFLINLVNKLVKSLLAKRNVEPSVKSFVGSLVNVGLTILLIVSVVGALGVQTTSFAALLASAGVAVGMALSGNLSNFAGGLIILLFKPFKVGDYVEAQGTGGTVSEIQIFHTILKTPDNKVVYVPNGALSSGTVTNYSTQTERRVDWTFNVSYGADFDKVKQVIEALLACDMRVKKTPAHFIALNALADSSVNIVVRVWVDSADYWDVFFDMNKTVYEAFNATGIEFPFPQLTVHQAK